MEGAGTSNPVDSTSTEEAEEQAGSGVGFPTWVKVVLAVEMLAHAATGLIAFFFLTVPLDIPVYGQSSIDYSATARGWGVRQLACAVPFMVGFRTMDRRVFQAALVTFLVRCVGDLLTMALDGFPAADTALFPAVTEALPVTANGLLGAYTLYFISQ